MAKSKIEEAPNLEDLNSSSKNLLGSLLDGNKADHYNRVENIYTKVSSGSLFLDAEICITQGIHRFCGPPGAGKTSAAATIINNFLKDEKRGKALWIKAEGRLSENIMARSGVKFVFKEEEWDYGTCFVLESNTFEFICSTIETLVGFFREQGDKLAIVIDSVDGLKLKSDAGKKYGSERTAGPQLIMKRFLKEAYYPIVKNGVICIAISQVTSTISQDEYQAPPLVSGGGGNALLHWASYILEFSSKYWGDNILKDGPNTKFDPKDNPIIGHKARVTIKKSDRENESKKVEYPIKHGRTNGNSIWIEHEIITFAKKWGLLDNKGAWFNFPEPIVKEIKEALNIDIESKHQGFNNILLYLESNPVLTKYLFDRIRTVEGKQ